MASLTRAISITMHQIQQQAFVAERTWCDFVVQGSTNELFQQRVPFNTA